MKKEDHKELIALLVRMYNHSIQTYYQFPEVIIYGNHRLDREEFLQLLDKELIVAYYADSFGQLYKLSKKADELLQDILVRKRRRPILFRQRGKVT
jgi:hypothetical protein